MNAVYIWTLYDYDCWANQRVLAAAEKLSADEFTRDLGSSHSSIRHTLVHILSSEQVWLSRGRWSGSSPRSHLDPTAFTDLGTLRRTWSRLETEMSSFVALLTDEQLLHTVAYMTLAGQPQSQPLWQQMTHLANHSTYHRGQVTTMMRQLHAEPIPTDLIAFFRKS